MQHTEGMKAASFDLTPLDVCQQDAVSLVEALQRWLDDGGALDNETPYIVGVEDFSPLQFVKPQGGEL